MLFLNRIAPLSLKTAAGAALSLLVLSGGAVAQDQGQSQPKTAGPQSAPAATEEPAPPSPPGWVVNCASSQAGLDCRASQTLFVKDTKQRFLSVFVRVPPDTKKPALLLRLPFGIYLPAGVSVQFGKEPAKKIALQSCDQKGCLAEYGITEGEIAAMLKGADLTISVQNVNKKPITVQVPVAGFPEAYAKIR